MNYFKLCTIILLYIKYVFGKYDQSYMGKPINKYDYPFFVQLIIGNNILESEGISHRCAGTLVHPQWVLTAAHCFHDIITNDCSKRVPKFRIKAYMGTNKVVDDTTKCYIRFVHELIAHPHYMYEQYNAGSMQDYIVKNDIAVAKVNSPFLLSRLIQTVELPNCKTRLCDAGILLGMEPFEKTRKTNKIMEYSPIHPRCVTDLTLKPNYCNSKSVFFSETDLIDNVPITSAPGGPFLCVGKTELVQYGVISNTYKNTQDDTVITQYESVGRHMRFIKKYVPYIP